MKRAFSLLAAAALAVFAFAVPASAISSQNYFCSWTSNGTTGVFNVYNNCGAYLPSANNLARIVFQGSSQNPTCCYESLWLKMNGDEGNNYDYVNGAATYNATAILVNNIPTSGGRNAASQITFPNYSSTVFYKTMWSLGATSILGGSGGLFTGSIGGNWHKPTPSAVTHISLLLGGTTNFTVGTKVDVFIE